MGLEMKFSFCYCVVYVLVGYDIFVIIIYLDENVNVLDLVDLCGRVRVEGLLLFGLYVYIIVYLKLGEMLNCVEDVGVVVCI